MVSRELLGGESSDPRLDLYRRLEPIIPSVCKRLGESELYRTCGEDLLHEAWARAWGRIQVAGADGGRLARTVPWLWGIARNLARETLRKLRQRTILKKVPEPRTRRRN